MRGNERDTPPSSVNGDEITGMEDEIIYLDEMEELQFDEEMEDVSDQEEEDAEMEPPEDHAKLVFNKHNGSVFCCDIHPSGKLAATGGEDDKAYVWSVETGEVVLDCTGHKDSVIFVGFSSDGAYLATADMCGLIKVWKCNLENNDPWTVAFEYEADDLTWGQWHFGARVLIFGTVNGDIFVFKVPSGDTKVLQGHNSRVECGKLFKDGVRLAAGYEDGGIKVWDLKTSTVVQHIQPEPNQIRVTAIDTHPENNLLAAISTDGKVILATSSNGKIVGQLETEIDLESVAFVQDSELAYLALGTLNGAVSIWDTTRQMVRHHCAKSTDDVVAGVTKLIWVKTDLVTGCLDGSLRIYDGRSGQQCAMLTGHRSEVLDLCYNEKENLILTTSDDGTARIFKYEVNKGKD
ncbi:angio-associated migratory cell protein [Pectinophora gossypiella]|uniref:angio-associated migratory cell protein n=1 Tax=Pectinophora gossypiella TaxID=13191 RepID=UPI00214ED9FC|nr:angio-associated migratory cell protein [Pectinophora gossypiella]